jgi:aspartyl-tRNA(Asn)/glutamyl-tRNA(Gln) amidotransferase subunit A
MAAAHQAARDIGAHAAEPHDADLHAGLPLAINPTGNRYSLSSPGVHSGTQPPRVSAQVCTMAVDDIAFVSASDLARMIRSKQVSAVEAMRATLARAETAQAALNCFITICAERALDDAAAADKALAEGREVGPLHGVPFHAKDLINTAGVRTTFASYIFEHNVPKEDAVAVARLKRAGAILMGKTTTPEFGHMPYTEAALFGRTRNAWAADRTSGGSSGGAAVALAAGVCPIGVGTDAGGSTRIPAACNGVVGIKQSSGVIPHEAAPEAFANVSSVNPVGRSVMDAALMLEAMAGPHPSDPYALGVPSTGFAAAAAPEGSLKRLRVAWRPLMGNAVVDSEVLDLCERAALALGKLGAAVEPMDDDLEPVQPIWFAYSSAIWAARFRDALPQWRDKMSPTLLRQMEQGRDITGEAVGRALLARTQLYRKVEGWLQRFDVILTPTLARTAIPIEERLFEPIEIEGQKVDTVRKAWYPYTHPFNLTGHPAITLPCGFHSDGLPVAIQLVGRRGEDARLLKVAALYEQARPWAGRRPKIDGTGAA